MTAVFWASYALMWVVIVVQGLALLELVRQIAQIRRQIGQPEGVELIRATELASHVPAVAGRSGLTGAPARLEDYLNGPDALLVLLSTTCGTCRTVAAELSTFARNVRSEATVVTLLRGKWPDAREFMDQTGLDPGLVVVDEDGDIAKALGVEWNPAVVTVTGTEVIEAGMFTQIDQLDSVLPSRRGSHVVAS